MGLLSRLAQVSAAAGDEGSPVRTTVLVLTELVRWMAFVVPIYMAAWRWAEFQGFTLYISESNARAEYWGLVTAIFMACSLLVYLPIKLCCVKYLNVARTEWGWRPSVLQYVLLCALPSFTLILVAVKTPGPDGNYPDMTHMDEDSMIALQMTVLGLTITEWMAKLREEVFTYDLVSAMAVDFFFAYDVIDFLMMLYHDDDVFTTDWIYVTFVFSFIAMFKYLPTQPTKIFQEGGETPQGAVTSILVTMFVQDVPFVIIRVIVLIEHDFRGSDLIHPLKNSAFILFGLLQLYIIHRNQKTLKEKARLEFEERRVTRRVGRERFIQVVHTVTAGLAAQRVAGAGAGAGAGAAGATGAAAQSHRDGTDGVELAEREPAAAKSIYPAIDY